MTKIIKCPSGVDVTEEECSMCGQCKPRPKHKLIFDLEV